MLRKKLRIGLDYDDVLAYCNQYALEIINKDRGTNYTINDIKGWNQEDDTLKDRLKLFRDPDFVLKQPLMPGAKDFIKKLSQKTEVFITSAVEPECMSARAMRIIEDFPSIKPENIILGASKGIYDLDMILDDGQHNFLNSQATYPVLMRQPWNQSLSGVLSVNNYDDFLHLVDLIANSYNEEPDFMDGGVVCLVGPSGSGKTAIMQELIKDSFFVKPITTTTRTKRDDETDDAYRFITKEEFISEKDAGCFLETSVYGNHFYGTPAEQIDGIIEQGKIAVLPIDICGAITIKNIYRSKSLLFFVDRKRSDLLLSLLERNISNEEKMQRIISLDDEYKNEILCDEVVRNDSTIESAARKVRRVIGL